MNGAGFSEEDRRFMRMALEEASKARLVSPPNPSVGCVIVQGGEVLGRGFTQKAGGPHAEVMALRDAIGAGRSVEGATAYVTLEPCSHFGRTPPCCDALLANGIGRVVAAATDPNPQVSGRGLARLREGGVEVASGLFEKEAREVNAGFMKRMETGLPYVRMKTAASLDGRTAFLDGTSKWITGPEARADVQYWRALSGAVVTGIGTVRADDPRMDARLEGLVRKPLRVVLDPSGSIDRDARFLSIPDAVVVTTRRDPGLEAFLKERGHQFWVLPDKEDPGKVSLHDLLLKLASVGVNDVLLEAGARLNGAFLEADLVDEIVFYQAPCLLGEGLGVAAVPNPPTPGDARRWNIVDSALFGRDQRLILRR